MKLDVAQVFYHQFNQVSQTLTLSICHISDLPCTVRMQICAYNDFGVCLCVPVPVF